MTEDVMPDSPRRLRCVEVGDALVVQWEDTDLPGLEAFAASLAPDPEHVLVVLEAGAEDLSPEAWAPVLPVLAARSGSIRLIPGASSVTSSLQVGRWIAGQLGLPVLAHHGTALRGPQGTLFVPAVHGPGWLCLDGPEPTSRSRWFPRPAWACAILERTSVLSDAAVTEPLPGGVWIRPAGPGTAAAAEQRRPWLSSSLARRDDGAYLVLGLPGAAPVPVADIEQLWRLLPPATRESARFVPFGPVAVADGQSLGQALADRLGEPVTACTGVPCGGQADGDLIRVRALADDGSPSWEPFAAEVRYFPALAAPVTQTDITPVLETPVLQPQPPRAAPAPEAWGAAAAPARPSADDLESGALDEAAEQSLVAAPDSGHPALVRDTFVAAEDTPAEAPNRGNPPARSRQHGYWAAAGACALIALPVAFFLLRHPAGRTGAHPSSQSSLAARSSSLKSAAPAASAKPDQPMPRNTAAAAHPARHPLAPRHRAPLSPLPRTGPKSSSHSTGGSSPAASPSTSQSSGPSSPPPSSEPSSPPPSSPPAAQPSNVNLALGKSVTATSYIQVYYPANVTDGSTSTYWEGAANAFPQTVTVDLGSVTSIAKIVLALPPVADWNSRTQTLQIDGSQTSATPAFTIVPSAGYTFNAATNNDEVTINFAPTDTRYITLQFTANSGWTAAQLAEIFVYS
jgi:hypothetical protein